MATSNDNSDSLSQIIEQAVYLINENESIFYVRNVNQPGLTTSVDKLMILLAILKKAGYVSGNTTQSVDQTNEYDSTFYYYLNNDLGMKTNDDFTPAWNRSQSGYWSYVIR